MSDIERDGVNCVGIRLITLSELASPEHDQLRVALACPANRYLTWLLPFLARKRRTVDCSEGYDSRLLNGIHQVYCELRRRPAGAAAGSGSKLTTVAVAAAAAAVVAAAAAAATVASTAPVDASSMLGSPTVNTSSSSASASASASSSGSASESVNIDYDSDDEGDDSQTADAVGPMEGNAEVRSARRMVNQMVVGGLLNHSTILILKTRVRQYFSMNRYCEPQLLESLYNKNASSIIVYFSIFARAF